MVDRGEYSSIDQSLTDISMQVNQPLSMFNCLNPSSAAYKWIALAFMCILSFGSYYCYDNPAALEDNLVSDLSLSNAQYGLLYSVYSWPNVVLPFLGGFLIDRVLGVRVAGVLFAALIMIGQVVFASGALVDSFALMIVGRLIFSLAGENLAVTQNNYAVKWFQGAQLNTVFGVQLSFSRLGSTINLYAMKPLYEAVRNTWPDREPYVIMGTTLMFGGLSTVVSFMVAFVLARMDYRNDRFKESIHQSTSSNQDQSIDYQNIDEPINKTEETVNIMDVLKFPLAYWLLCVVCVAYYVSIFPLVGYGLVFFESKFGLSPYPGAEICNSLIYFISIAASAPCGMLVDAFGRNTHWMVLAIMITFGGHSLLAFTFITPYVAMSLLGVSYSLLAASLWPSVAYLVPQQLLGTAYGVMQAIQNLGLAVLFWSAGAVLDLKGYLALEIYFLMFLSVALVTSIALLSQDSMNDGYLSASAASRAERDAKRE